MNTFVETFSGMAGVSLALVGGPACEPPTGYMGGKRRQAPQILGAMGTRVGAGAEHVVLVDAGPCGEMWGTVFSGGAVDVCKILRGWEGRDPSALWHELAEAGPPAETPARVASWLWLQARSASCTPVWWEHDEVVMSGAGGGDVPTDRSGRAGARLVMADKPGKWQQPPEPGEAVQRTRHPKSKGEAHKHKAGGIVHPSTIADRIERIAAAPWRRVTVLRSHAELLALDVDWTRAHVYADPPYQGCTRYAAVCPRDEVLALCRGLADRGARVAVSEAVPLPLDGWHTMRLDCRAPEWLTCSHPPTIKPQRAVQLHLYQENQP